MQRRKFLGIYDLDWPWPVRPEALGLFAKLETESGVVHLRLPDQATEKDRDLFLPSEFRLRPHAEAGSEPFVAARRYDEDRFRIFGVGIVLWCAPGHESIRVDELRRRFTEVDQWIAWLASEPPGVQEQTANHLVDLWSPGLRLWRTASYSRFIYQGKGHGAATSAAVISAISRVSDDELLPLAPRLWCEARSFQARHKLRNAVVAAATSAEVAIEAALYRAVLQNEGPDAAEEALTTASGIVERFDLLLEMHASPGTNRLPSRGKVISQIAGVRNRAVHSGRFPTQAETRNSMAASRELIEATQ